MSPSPSLFVLRPPQHFTEQSTNILAFVLEQHFPVEYNLQHVCSLKFYHSHLKK